MPSFTLVITPHRLKLWYVLTLHEELIAFIKRIVIDLLVCVFWVLWTLLILYVLYEGIVRHVRLHKLLILYAHADYISVIAVCTGNSG